MNEDHDRTAAFMSPAKLAQLKQQKQPASSSAFLDQMATDVGHQQVVRMADLRGRMQAQGSARDFSPLAASLDRFAQALPQLDFALLEPKGWLARATGKQRSAGAEFSGQYENIVAAAGELRQHVQAQQKQALAEASAIERTIVEFDVECSGLEKILDHGTRWLHDMRADLKTRQASSPDPAALQSIKDDAARCEALVERLKALKSAAAAARQLHQQAQVAAQRRSGALLSAQQLFSTQFKQWQARLAPIASAAGDSGSPALSMEGPLEVHRDLQLHVDQTAAECRQLLTQEQALAEQVAALDESLRSVG